MSTQERRRLSERGRDRFVFWTNGLLILLVLAIPVAQSLNWIAVTP